MAKILGYIASSLDGFIADAQGGLEWLSKYDDMHLGEHDYASFIKSVRTIVMGRATYDWLAADGGPWPYAGLRTFVVTSQAIDNPKGELESRSDLQALISELRALNDGDVWIVGGGRLQMAFIQQGALDELEIFVIPEIAGGGAPLFPATGMRASPTLISSKTLDKGCVRLHYRF